MMADSTVSILTFPARDGEIVVDADLDEIRSDMGLLATKDELQDVADGLDAANQEIQDIRSDMSSFLTDEDLQPVNDELDAIRSDMSQLATKDEV